MAYKQFKPDPALSPYIDAFWEVTSDETNSFTERIMPDCCIDIIINLGTDVMADDSGVIMKNERAYLIGTMTPSFHLISNDFIGSLNHFFFKKLSPLRQSIFHILEQVYERRGLINVVELAKNNFMIVRQLERIFIQHMGIPPKAFINFVRYQFAIQNIREHYPAQSLVDLSFDCGYYDHAHLANEIKKYSGVSPSQL